MYRLFNTHNKRRVREADGLWDFRTETGSYAGKLAVPSCWEIIPTLASYKGKAEYKKTFTLGGNIRLVFKGVSHTARLFVDGEFICEHYNAYTEFCADLSLPYGEHEARIEVDNSYSETSALHVENDYYTYGGITRPVIIEELSDAVINYIHFTPKKTNDGWSAFIEAEIESLAKSDVTYELRFNIDGRCDTLGEVHLPAGERVKVSGEFSFANVIPYTPSEPKLYALSAELYREGEIIDDLIDRVGFREIKAEGKKLLLNGEPLRLLGFNRHEDYNSLGSSVPLQAMMRDLALIKDTGANSIRTSHYPNDELFLDLCDEMGILVWEEAHARGLGDEQMKNPNFIPQSLKCIDEMITRHYNHPSIFCWGILNECSSDTEYGRSCYKTLFDRVFGLDRSRPRTFASNKHFHDICFDLEEIVSANIYPGWYNFADLSAPDKMVASLMQYAEEQKSGDKPFIVSEIGAGAIYGYRAESAAKWSEERQAQIIDEQLTAVLANEDVTGVFVWQFCDVRVDESWFSGRPRSMNNKGIVDEYRRKKLSFEVVKRHFAQKQR